MIIILPSHIYKSILLKTKTKTRTNYGRIFTSNTALGNSRSTGILQDVRVLQANRTQLSTTSETLSYLASKFDKLKQNAIYQLSRHLSTCAGIIAVVWYIGVGCLAQLC